MTLEELYKLCQEHSSVMLAEIGEQLIVDWLPNLPPESKVLGEIFWGDIFLGIDNSGHINIHHMTIYPYLPSWSYRNPEQVRFYTEELYKDLIGYLNA